MTIGDRTQGIDNFLQGGGGIDYIVCVVDVGPFGDNGEEGGRYYIVGDYKLVNRIFCNRGVINDHVLI